MEDFIQVRLLRVGRSIAIALSVGASLLTLASCSPKTAAKGPARMTVQFPSASELGKVSNKIQTLATYDFAKACFAVNVTGGSILPSRSTSKCDVPVGVFHGFVAPGGSISLTVPNGAGYKMEVFAFARANATDACPSPTEGMKGVDPSRIAVVGTVAAFDALEPEVSLTVEISPPSSNLAAERSLPQSCSSSGSGPALASASIVSGRAVQTGGGYKLIGVVAGTKNEVKLSGGGFTMRLSRRPQ